MIRTTFLLLALLAVSQVTAQVTSSITVIPQPVRAYGRAGAFELKPDTRIYFPKDAADFDLAAQYLLAVAQPSTGFALSAQPLSAAPGGQLRENGIYLLPDASVPNAEGYEMEVAPTHIAIRASTAAGAFYGVQSLRQMFPPQFNSPTPVQGVAWTVGCCTMSDAPRFGYRGMHLDVGRHFFPVDFVKRYIDLLALHKFNRFHWHLTE
ncbi:MAG: family 20 glycosylhydrolase, partial [Saprospiraceae bacterium]|nr:family 20 glycosylhydrolase [Saprospiraceae bacterium]